MPDDIDVPWDSDFDGLGDRLVAVVPVDVMLYDASSGDPLADTRLDVTCVDAACGLLHADELTVASPGEDAVWDAWRDRFVETSPPEERISLWTDDTGLARLHVVLDALDAPATVVVVVTESAVEQTFALSPR